MEENLTKKDWWAGRYQHMNRSLSFSGIAVFLLTLSAFFLLDREMFEAPLYVVSLSLIIVLVFIIYMGIVNFVLILVELLDKKDFLRLQTRNRVSFYNSIYWVSLLIPFLYPLFLLFMYFFVPGIH